VLRLAAILSVPSLLGMILIDRALGARAGFLNAWSVIERLVGRSPTAGSSVVASHVGALGELVVVIAANVAIGTLLAMAARLLAGLLR